MRNQHWHTFRGKHVSFETIDHQHISNCYWFGLIVRGLPSCNPHLINIKAWLSERFNGQILPYRPHVDFYQEVDVLRSMGCLKCASDPGGFGEEIWFEGKRIGEIVKPLL